MGLYCFRGSILYRWRSVMSTARSSALWKRLIWETQSSSLVTPQDKCIHTHIHTHITHISKHPAGRWTRSSWVYLFVQTDICWKVCACGKWWINALNASYCTLRTLQENRTLMNLSFRCSSLETSVNDEAVSGLSRFCRPQKKHRKPVKTL